MLNNEHSASLLNQLSHNASMQHEAAYGTLIEKAEYNLVAMLKPQIFKDGDKWCVLYGENIQDGICGFGDTPYQAVLDFNKAWNKK